MPRLLIFMYLFRVWHYMIFGNIVTIMIGLPSEFPFLHSFTPFPGKQSAHICHQLLLYAGQFCTHTKKGEVIRGVLLHCRLTTMECCKIARLSLSFYILVVMSSFPQFMVPQSKMAADSSPTCFFSSFPCFSLKDAGWGTNNYLS